MSDDIEGISAADLERLIQPYITEIEKLRDQLAAATMEIEKLSNSALHVLDKYQDTAAWKYAAETQKREADGWKSRVEAAEARLARVEAAAREYRKVAKVAIEHPVAGPLWMEQQTGQRLDAVLGERAEGGGR